MLKKRIIPVLLLKEGRMVKGRQFSDYRDVGDPITAAKVYNAQKVDELVFLNIEPNVNSMESIKTVIKSVARECFMPLTVGGGINAIDDIYTLLSIGADKVSINTASVLNPSLIEEGSKIFGDQCILVSIDYMTNADGNYKVFINSGKTETDLDPLQHLLNVVALGAGEVILTNIKNEGTMLGYDLNLLKKATALVSIPVIASGGAGNLSDFYNAFDIAKVSAVSASSIFHFTDQSPIKARFFLNDHNINVRI